MKLELQTTLANELGHHFVDLPNPPTQGLTLSLWESAPWLKNSPLNDGFFGQHLHLSNTHRTNITMVNMLTFSMGKSTIDGTCYHSYVSITRWYPMGMFQYFFQICSIWFSYDFPMTFPVFSLRISYDFPYFPMFGIFPASHWWIFLSVAAARPLEGESDCQVSGILNHPPFRVWENWDFKPQPICSFGAPKIAFSWFISGWSLWFMVDIYNYSIHGDYFMVYKPT